MNEFFHQQGRAAVTGEIGERLDKTVEQAQCEVQRLKGEQEALARAAKAVLGLHAHIDKDMEEGKLDQLSSTLQISSYVKGYVTKAANALESLHARAKAHEVGAHGKVEGMKAALEVIQRYHDSSTRRASQILEAAKEQAETGADETRPPRGGRKAVAERRQEAAQAVTSTDPEKPKRKRRARRATKKAT